MTTTLGRGMRLALEQEGWTVTEAENGRIALARLQRSPARRRSSSISMMPEMDGFEFLDEMRRQAEWRDIPVRRGHRQGSDRRRTAAVSTAASNASFRKTDRDDMLREVRAC